MPGRGRSHAGNGHLFLDQRDVVRVGAGSRASRIATSLACDSASSASGSEPATMPQPAYSRSVLRSTSAAAQRDPQLAVAAGVDPADRPGVPAAVHPLELADDRERPLGRCAADRGGRVQRRGEREHRGGVGERAGDVGRQVLDVREPQQRRRSRHGQVGAVRGRARPPTELTAYSCSAWSFADASSADASEASWPESAERRTVPASTREVTSVPMRRTSISGVAPTRPSTAYVQHEGYVAASRSSRWRASTGAGAGDCDVAREHHLVQLADRRSGDRLGHRGPATAAPSRVPSE